MTTSRTRPGPLLGAAAAFLLALGLLAPAASASLVAKVDAGLQRAADSASGPLSVIVRETTPASSEAERLVSALDGRVVRELAIVGGFSAQIPSDRLAELADSPTVARIWGDGQVTVQQVDMGRFDTLPANTVWQRSIRLPQATASGHTGAGVTVAVLDTGISQVADLGDRVLARVDFTPELDGYDRYGHGTHMAGIIAGDGTSSAGAWVGVAPGANLVSVKVAGADGSTDVSVVLAGLEWIVSHKDEYGIRILNLAFGTDSMQPYEVDPLNYAVEQAWFAGIFVVVSAGNRGSETGTINKPGDDPFVLTVGAADLRDTIQVSDDTIAPFSSAGPTADGFTKPDISAPGVTLVSNRVIAGTADLHHPLARIGDAYFKGSGTSQAAAVVSGVAALMFQADPSLTPDVAKAILMGTAKSANGLKTTPLVDAFGAAEAALRHRYDARPANQGLVPSNGLGSLEGSRGTFHVYADMDGDGVMEPVVGEVDVLGALWDARSWSARSWSSGSWDGAAWSPYVAESDGWDARSWSARSWSGTCWDARSWSGSDWSAAGWSGGSWS